jgi:hypothetical protein
MSKPIFIVRLTRDEHRSNPDKVERVRYELQRSSIAEDYHIIVMADPFTGGQTKFECYNAPHTEMEFEELQRRVLELLKD